MFILILADDISLISDTEVWLLKQVDNIYQYKNNENLINDLINDGCIIEYEINDDDDVAAAATAAIDDRNNWSLKWYYMW
jgi:hypothetical protein